MKRWIIENLELDRECGMTLADQLVSRLKELMIRRRCRPGEILPGMLEIASAARVSEKVVRVALHRLADDGWIHLRRHVGPIVSQRGAKGARWRVLHFTHNPYFCYYNHRFIATLRARLLREKDGVSLVSVCRGEGDHDFLQLDEALKERWDLILEGDTDSTSRKMIQDSGWPFVMLGAGAYAIPSKVTSCVGRVDVSIGRAAGDFVRACARRNVRSVVQMQCDRGSFDVTDMLRIMGVAVRTERTQIGLSPDEVAYGAYAIIDRWFKRGKPRLPDVILFTDDYLAQGGLLALCRHGVRIPEDVGVVSFSSKGHLPIWDQNLTRIEVDAVADGATIAQAVRSFLHGEQFPYGISIGSTWKPGDTF